MLKKLLLIFLFAFQVIVLFGQRKNINIGFLDTNYDDWEVNRKNPKIVYTMFYFEDGEWNCSDSTNADKDLKIFSVFYGNRRLGILDAEYSDDLPRIGTIESVWRIKSKWVPRFSKPTTEFSGWIGAKKYRPLLVTNQDKLKQYNPVTFRDASNEDSAKIIKFIKNEAEIRKLGDIKVHDENLISKMSRLTLLNDSSYLVTCDTRVNVECIRLDIPFNRELRRQKDYYNYEMQYFDGMNITERACFLVRGTEVKYLGINLKYLDSADYDGDGYDEVILHFDRYNHDGYSILTDRLTKIISNGWTYH